MLWMGQVPTWDTSKVRPAGSPLKTFGGRASGPEPLEDLFKFSINIFKMQKEENSNQSKHTTWFAKSQRLSWSVALGVLLLSVLVTWGIGKCDTPSLETGGRQMCNGHLQTTPSIIKKNQTLELSCESGYPSMIPNLVREVSTIVCLPNGQQKN